MTSRRSRRVRVARNLIRRGLRLGRQDPYLRATPVFLQAARELRWLRANRRRVWFSTREKLKRGLV